MCMLTVRRTKHPGQVVQPIGHVEAGHTLALSGSSLPWVIRLPEDLVIGSLLARRLSWGDLYQREFDYDEQPHVLYRRSCSLSRTGVPSDDSAEA